MGTLLNLLNYLRIAGEQHEQDERDYRHEQRHAALQSFPSSPFPQRLSAQDTRAYRQPGPQSHENYLTFWNGNQLPGAYLHVVPHVNIVPVQSQTDLAPRLAGGSFGRVLTPLQSANLIATWRATFSSLTSRY